MAILDTKALPKSINQILKPGTYSFTVNEFEEKKDKKENVFLHLKLQLLDDSKKFFLFDRFYISHGTSEQAVNIGKARLGQFFNAVGYEGVFDSEKDCGNFIDSVFQAETKVEKDNLSGDDQTKIKKFLPKAQSGSGLAKKLSSPPPVGNVIKTTAPSAMSQTLDDIPF